MTMPRLAPPLARALNTTRAMLKGAPTGQRSMRLAYPPEAYEESTAAHAEPSAKNASSRPTSALPHLPRHRIAPATRNWQAPGDEPLETVNEYTECANGHSLTRPL